MSLKQKKGQSENAATKIENFQNQTAVVNRCLQRQLGTELFEFRKILYEDDNNHGQMPQISQLENTKWRTTTILKIVLSPYFSGK